MSSTYTLSDFDFDLPAHLIAQRPAPQRSGSRLLDSSHSPPADRIFRDLPQLLSEGDLLVMNDTRVLKVAGKDESVAAIRRALANEDGPVRDIVLLNAGAAVYTADVAASVTEGVKRAREAVASGAAARKLEQFVATTQKLAG